MNDLTLEALVIRANAERDPAAYLAKAGYPVAAKPEPAKAAEVIPFPKERFR